MMMMATMATMMMAMSKMMRMTSMLWAKGPAATFQLPAWASILFSANQALSSAATLSASAGFVEPHELELPGARVGDGRLELGRRGRLGHGLRGGAVLHDRLAAEEVLVARGREEGLLVVGDDAVLVVAQGEALEEAEGVHVHVGDEVRGLALGLVAHDADDGDRPDPEAGLAHAGEGDLVANLERLREALVEALEGLLRDDEAFLVRPDEVALLHDRAVEELPVIGGIDPEEEGEALLLRVLDRREAEARDLAGLARDSGQGVDLGEDLVAEGEDGRVLLAADGLDAEEAHRALGLARDEDVARVIGDEGVLHAQGGRVHEGVANYEDDDPQGEEAAYDEGLGLVFEEVPERYPDEDRHVA